MPTSYRYGTPTVMPTGTCCCTGTGSPLGGCDCPCCSSGNWDQYELVVAGVTDAGGIGCNGGECLPINGAFTLKFRGLIGGSCFWDTDDSYTLDCGAVPNTDNIWTLECRPLLGSGSGDYWILYPVDTEYWYELIPGTGDPCIDGAEFSLQSVALPIQCATYPATLTIIPSGTFSAC